MSIWYCIPSARPYEESTLPKWKAAGYRIALWRDAAKDQIDSGWRDKALDGIGMVYYAEHYPGYAVAVNTLVKNVLRFDPECQWVITGGDDVAPDANVPPEEIALQCENHFAPGQYRIPGAATFGVMQPTGDRWEERPGRVYSEQVCGSPWLGRSFCERMYHGRGPLFEGYQHMFVDEELQHVGKRLGVLWQRPDLIHYHDHPLRKPNATAADIPAHMVKWNTEKHWRESKNLFQVRLAGAFPGSEPLEAK